MAQAARLFVYLLANSCEHNSYSFQQMILKPSRIVTYGMYLCIRAGYFYLSFPNRVMPRFQIFAYAYIANSLEHNSSYSLQQMVLEPSRSVTHGTSLYVKAGFVCSSFPNRGMPRFQIFAHEYSWFPYWGTTFPWGV